MEIMKDNDSPFYDVLPNVWNDILKVVLSILLRRLRRWGGVIKHDVPELHAEEVPVRGQSYRPCLTLSWDHDIHLSTSNDCLKSLIMKLKSAPVSLATLLLDIDTM